MPYEYLKEIIMEKCRLMQQDLTTVLGHSEFLRGVFFVHFPVSVIE